MTVARTTTPRDRLFPVSPRSSFHERLEIGDRALHRARALHDLRQEHPPGAEEVADDLHAVHERPLDHVERPVDTLTRLLDILLDVVDDPVHERVLEPFLDRLFPPGEIDLALRRIAFHALRVLEQSLRRIGPTVEDQILDEPEQLGADVLVDRELPGVDDAHVEPRLDGVEEERGVNRLAHVVRATERKREIRDATRHARSRAALLDQPDRLDERLRELGMLLDPGADGEDVGVEDDVLGREAGALGEQRVRPRANLDLAIDGLGLALLVERHHERCGP